VPGASPATPEPAAPPKPTAVRRTYLICIDSLHSAFANLVHVRQALTKLFASEPAGDARYVLAAVGTSTEVVQGPTSDPAAVLRIIESKSFQGLFLASRKSSTNEDLRDFRRDLDRARQACDTGDPSCASLKRMLPPEASRIAELERVYTVAFLQQLRHLVEQLAKETGRRTIVLFSDGFQMVPGKEAFELLAAYFGDSGASLRAQDRMPNLEPILRFAANHNVPVYSIDSRGLYGQSYFDAANSGSSPRLGPAVMGIMNSNDNADGETLSEMAAATGGLAFKNSNDIFGGLVRAFADGRQYYMLAYVPVNPNSDGKFRAISVRMRDAKLMVNAKRGYWATQDAGGG
jgi:VWFA-related protein